MATGRKRDDPHKALSRVLRCGDARQGRAVTLNRLRRECERVDSVTQPLVVTSSGREPGLPLPRL